VSPYPRWRILVTMVGFFCIRMTFEPKTDEMLVDTLVANSAEEARGNYPAIAKDR
jgi:hypothetical protein